LGLGFGLHPYPNRAATPKPACPPNVPGVYEPATRARRLRSFFSATAVTKLQVAEGTFAVTPKAGWHGACPLSTSSKRRDRGKRAVRPSDERSEERCVNPLILM